MVLYILSCVNEEYATVDTQAFSREEEAYQAMKERYEKELNAISSQEENNVFDNYLDFSHGNIYWMDEEGTIFVYEFNVSEVEFVPEMDD
jgi:hypothetical protein